MAYLELESLSKSFGKVRAVGNVSLPIEKGECLALLGPSGCGKTTLLRMIAGLEPPDTGRIILDGKDVTKLPPEKRRIGFVFQNYALFPHLSVFDNVAFGLAARGKNRAEIEKKVGQSLDVVQLSGLERRMIYQLSGGQQQRVAIARAIVIEPEVLLLDEPLSNLDVTLREQTGQQLRALIEKLAFTTIFVTHDQSEAFTLADRIALVNSGTIEQVGTAKDLYFKASSLFVAGFIGHSNFLPAKKQVIDKNGFFRYEVKASFQVVAPKSDFSDVVVRIRPEAIKLKHEPTSSAVNVFAAKVKGYRFTGANIHYSLEVAGVELEATQLSSSMEAGSMKMDGGSECWIEFAPEDVTIFRKE